MRALIQRVSQAKVSVNGEIAGDIGSGICALVGVTHRDREEDARKLAEKIWNLRIFEDEAGAMNRSVSDVGGSILVVSQFTLYGDTRKGRRPSFIDAARPEVAEPLINVLTEHLRDLGATVATGKFRTTMDVELTNTGPVTLMIEV